jgi:hypothetical protein
MAILIVAVFPSRLTRYKLIGIDTGVELFLLPCVLLATILFRPGERLVMLAVSAFPFGAYFLLDGSVGAPLASNSALGGDCHQPP